MSEAATPLLQVEHVGRHYRLPRERLLGPPPSVRALHDVSFMLRAGRSLGIVGESGSGKSTLARLVMALERPDTGVVRFDGQDLAALDVSALRRARAGFQMVFQDPYGSLDPRRSVLQTVAEPLAVLHGAGRDEQRACVGVRQPAEHVVGGPRLGDDAAVHHHHAAHGARHHAEVVADQQQAHAALGHQAGDEVEHLALHRHVERGGRLVGDQQVGPARQRDGDHHALTLAARQLVRIGVEPARGIGHLHPLQQLQRTPARFVRRQMEVQPQRLGDLVAHRVQRVERRHRLLEHHADAAAAQLAHRRLVETDQLAPVEADRAADLRTLGQQAHQRQRGDRLAAAGFTDQAHRLATIDGQRHAAQRVGRAARGLQRDPKVGDLQQAHVLVPSSKSM